MHVLVHNRKTCLLVSYNSGVSGTSAMCPRIVETCFLGFPQNLVRFLIVVTSWPHGQSVVCSPRKNATRATKVVAYWHSNDAIVVLFFLLDGFDRALLSHYVWGTFPWKGKKCLSDRKSFFDYRIFPTYELCFTVTSNALFYSVECICPLWVVPLLYSIQRLIPSMIGDE